METVSPYKDEIIEHAGQEKWEKLLEQFKDADHTFDEFEESYAELEETLKDLG